MTARSLFASISRNDRLNFLLTNCIPRRLATRFAGWFASIEQPIVRDLSIAIWRLFCNVDLTDAKKPRFASLRDCFIRELRDGARPIDKDMQALVSPCDAIVGACGLITGSDLLQVKGSSYHLFELLRDSTLAQAYRGGCYATLRLTAGMYHRFHAPHDCKIERLTHVWGDVWNVNPPALARVDKLFCRNERVIIRTRLQPGGQLVTLVPVAAILVAGIRLRFGELVVEPRRSLPSPGQCEISFARGQEMGWFEHGSTIILLAPGGTVLWDNIQPGHQIRVGQPLMRLPQSGSSPHPGSPR